MTTETQDTQIVDSFRIACDGGSDGTGHPRVWLQIPQTEGLVVCPYCDRKFRHQDACEAQ